MAHFETLTETELSNVAGGLTFSVDFAKGISIDSKLGSATLTPPKPSDIISGLKTSIVTALDNIGKLTTDLGQLFDFI